MSNATQPKTRELPLFPLPDVVLFPGCPLPLHIFEMRYREMVNTALASDKTFGVLNVNTVTGKPAKVGGTAKIVDCHKLPDGRMNILTMGQDRFRVKNFVQEKPYLVAVVEFIEDDKSVEDLNDKTKEVDELVRNILRLSGKISDREFPMPKNIPTEPQEFSYWIAGHLYGIASEQQTLLEMTDTYVRLSSESVLLDKTLKELAARSALKDAFKGK
ncbi:MAG: LON peptidase substrate-binding domain-containing protein [Candidatus Obscuribacterales bacterium]|nr:LON peptidase substrate-binding domain-containing protein [Candidatus Obscuribacterales bacterium]